MATVDKNFKVKHGLIVEGTTATVNGEDIITTGNTTDDIAEGSANLYFTAQRAADAVADEISTAVSGAINALTTSDIEEGTNLYFTDERAQDAIGGSVGDGLTYNDSTGAVSLKYSAYSGAIGFDEWGNVNVNVDGTSIDTSGSASRLRVITGAGSPVASKTYATDAATTAEGNANDYTDSAIGALSTVYDAIGAASAAQTAAESYADGLAVNYDAAGAAATAQGNAEDYTDTALASYTPTGDLDVTIGGYGYIKSADLSGVATETYVDTAVSTAVDALVDGAPALLDTLNEIAAAINDDANYATTLTTALAGKQDELTAGSNIDITGSTISVSGLDAADISDFNNAAFNATESLFQRPLGPGTGINLGTYSGPTAPAEVSINRTVVDAWYDAAGAAATAEANANDYADTTFVTLASLPGQLEDYVPVSEKGAALGVATLDASGYVPASQLNIDVSGDITAAIDALTTDDIEEGSTNLYFTDARAVDALEAVVPNFEEIDVNSVAKQIAATASVTGSTSNSVYTFRNAVYKSAKFLVKVTVGSDTEVSEILLVTDLSGNIAITEYANVASNASLSSITASYVGGSFISLDVTPTGNGTVKVFGTLLV